MARTMQHELVELVSLSKIKDLKYVVEVTPKGFTSALHDKNGQRGSAMSGSFKATTAQYEDEFNSLEGQARALIVQEAARALRADPDA